MAESGEEKDESQKTEEPTARLLEEARKKGQVAQSKEVIHWMMLASAAMILFFIFPYSLPGLKNVLTPFLEHPHLIEIAPKTLQELMQYILGGVGASLGFPFLLLIAAALTGALSQTKLVVSLDVLKPKLERISLSKGIKRLFSKKSLVEFIKSILKLVVLSAALIYGLQGSFNHVNAWVFMPISSYFEHLLDILYIVFATILSIVAVIAGLDYLYQRYEFLKSLRMTRDEVKREMKDAEGDPVIRGRLRQIRQERARKRMMAEVPGATVVITNPTHYSVALKYTLDDMNAPVVVAKGVDLVALKIREIAKENDVPLVESPPLARLLYNNVDLGGEIAPEHYNAVADIIRIVMEIKGAGTREKRGAS